MDWTKVLEALDACDAVIRASAVYSACLPVRVPVTEAQKKQAHLAHCLDMIVQMRGWTEDDLGKAFRWLGYIQGIMHGFDVADLETLKEMNRPTEADRARENKNEEAGLNKWIGSQLGKEPDDHERSEATGSPVDLRANVLAFHLEVVGGEMPQSPQVPREDIARRRILLIAEEFIEVMESCFDARGLDHINRHLLQIIANEPLQVDLVEFADGLADLEYVCEGAFLGFGIDSRPIHTEVQRSNMAKKGGAKRADGKSLKPEGWTPPDIKSLIDAQIARAGDV